MGVIRAVSIEEALGIASPMVSSWMAEGNRLLLLLSLGFLSRTWLVHFGREEEPLDSAAVPSEPTHHPPDADSCCRCLPIAEFLFTLCADVLL